MLGLACLLACDVGVDGLFVDASPGNDSKVGTQASPMKSIPGALGKLGGKPRVYVCDGTYPEHVKRRGQRGLALRGLFVRRVGVEREQGEGGAS